MLDQTESSRTVSRRISAIDIEITQWLARHGITFLRIGLGAVFLWFGLLKFIPGVSPAEEVAGRTIEILTFGLIPPAVGLFILAGWETVIGIGLISGIFLRATLLLLIVQMFGAMTPLAIFPAETFTRFPYAPTLEGQYILKNVVLIGAGLVIGATARGGHMVCEVCAHGPNESPGAQADAELAARR